MHLIARRERFHPIFDPRVGGERKCRGAAPARRVERAQPLDQRVAILPGQADVGNDHVGTPALHQLEGVRGVVAGSRHGTALKQNRLNHFERVALIVNGENAQAVEPHAHGCGQSRRG